MNTQNPANNNFTPIVSTPMGSLQAYIDFANKISVLSNDEETQLIQQMRDGDIEAARRLILAHLRFVIHVARSYQGYGLGLGDLIQEGNVGLMEAVKRFNPDANVRLVTFAVYWIKSKINDFILKNWRIVKIATTKSHKKLFFNLRSMKRNWFDEKDVQYICDTLKVTKKDVNTMIERLFANDTQIVDDYEEEALPQTLSLLGDRSYAPDQEAPFDSKTVDAMHQALNELDERSELIIRARWLNESAKATLVDLSKQLGVSHERVRQLEQEALSKLKQKLNRV
ncbi:MAG: RNA polymerase factor sigma-32 [Legionellales bacterium]|nr:RNA polymerase factor sigma-32 [Legionellales bacterium]OUX64629.1 MAG: hypothetical protein CBE41_02945 [Gammaproteobacteria bacterium TMED281]|tara:strand:- start:347 stop:1195 length:849 start_codon:yes stop_codon:yes gene_type:complete